MYASPFFAVLRSGLIVGILDITAACAHAYLARGTTPYKVFRYIASGVFGQQALDQNSGLEWAGLLFHFIIATGWTMLFFVAYPKLKILTKNKIYVGFGYGIFVWIMMNAVVLPLSNVPPLVYRLTPTLIGIGIHMGVIGLSISLLANQFYSKRITAI
ncbi:MAG: DUF1440 domain-containing protein [Bacteroidetes bacterium]|nr:DUF1440 domain-containing protein [Bacteroidota bacterium]